MFFKLVHIFLREMTIIDKANITAFIHSYKALLFFKPLLGIIIHLFVLNCHSRVCFVKKKENIIIIQPQY